MTQTKDKAVAGEIYRQLGGNRFKAMTGARNFTCSEGSLTFKLPVNKTKNRINYIRIVLTSRGFTMTS